MLAETDEKYFSFIVKASFNTSHRFDQCGIIVYLDSENAYKIIINCCLAADHHEHTINIL